jgi:hypothetical protein
MRVAQKRPVQGFEQQMRHALMFSELFWQIRARAQGLGASVSSKNATHPEHHFFFRHRKKITRRKKQ